MKKKLPTKIIVEKKQYNIGDVVYDTFHDLYGIIFEERNIIFGISNMYQTKRHFFRSFKKGYILVCHDKTTEIIAKAKNDES